MKKVPTTADAERIINLFFDFDFANRQIVSNDPELGDHLETVKLQCIVPDKNIRKFYHISIYDYGYICHYGRLSERLVPLYKSPFIKKFGDKGLARREATKKINEKLFDNRRGKYPYRLVKIENEFDPELNFNSIVK